jgi:hypothetical protein
MRPLPSAGEAATDKPEAGGNPFALRADHPLPPVAIVLSTALVVAIAAVVALLIDRLLPGGLLLGLADELCRRPIPFRTG